jgi:hypothetical protein
MGHPREWYQWRGTFLRFDRLRGRQLVENWDSCRRILVGCGIYELWVGGEWPPSFLDFYPISGVKCCGDTKHQVYGWVEHPSQEASCTTNLKDKCFILLLCYLMCLITVHELCVWGWFLCHCNELLVVFLVYFIML